MSALGLLLLDAGGAAVLEASIDAAGRFLDAGCAALPGVKVCVIETNLRMAGKLKLSRTAFEPQNSLLLDMQFRIALSHLKLPLL